MAGCWYREVFCCCCCLGMGLVLCFDEKLELQPVVKELALWNGAGWMHLVIYVV